jgi:hypothetical protein
MRRRSCSSLGSPAPSCLRTFPRPFASLFRADHCPIVPRNLSHSPTEYLRLGRALDVSVQGRVPHLRFPPQRVQPAAQRIVVRQITFPCDPVQLLIEGFGGFQPDGAPRIVDVFADTSLPSFSCCHNDAPDGRIRSSTNTAQPRSTTRLVPSALILAGHSGQSTRMEIQPRVEFLPKPTRACIGNRLDLTRQAIYPKQRNPLFVFRQKAAIGEPHKEIQYCWRSG